MIMKIALETMLPVLLQLISYYALCTTMLLEVHLAAGDFTGSKTTTYRIVHGVIAAIASLQHTPIKFPNTANEIKPTQLGFYNIAHFPLVVGAMEYGLHT